jgi:uncharacterized protein
MQTSNASGQSASPSGKLQHWMRAHPLASYFIIAYAFSWITLIPYVLSQWSILPNSSIFGPFHTIHTFGPTVAAVIMVSLLEGKEGIQKLRNRIKQWHIGWQWYLVVLLGIPFVELIGILLVPGASASFKGFTPSLLVSYPLYFILVFFGGGPLGEEIGWRGFALPRMQSRFGPLRATLILGVLWAFWHLEGFLTPGKGGGPGTGWAEFFSNFPVFLLMVVSIAVILTWVFNHTGGSILAAILAHASVNTPQLVIMPLFPAVTIAGFHLASLIGFGVPALLLIILTRGRLGFQPDQTF